MIIIIIVALANQQYLGIAYSTYAAHLADDEKILLL